MYTRRRKNILFIDLAEVDFIDLSLFFRSMFRSMFLHVPTPPATKRMDLHKTYAPNLLVFCFCIQLFFLVFKISATLVGHVPLVPFHPSENIAINCGFSGNTTALNGRKWIGDIGSMYFVPGGGSNTESIAVRLEQPSPNSHAAAIPYSTYARISQTQFTYVFPISPGPKFVRLHFYPASYRSFQRSNAYFTVKTNRYTLLHNFSASLTAYALGITTVSKEFCINVESNDQSFSITFSPSRISPSDKVYAFVNGIEVVSMPNGLYYNYSMNKKNEWDQDQEMGSTSFWGYTALETVHRLNIGGGYISSADDTGMFREWFEDTRNFISSIHHDLEISPLTTTLPIKYGKLPNYVAPQKVYQSSWSVVPKKESTFNNFTWKMPLDQGFRYLIRLHFCELDYEIQEWGDRTFCIYVNNRMIEPHGDIIKWSGQIGAATYKDYIYVVHGDRMDAKRNILISLCPIGSDIHHDNESSLELFSDVILKGLEIFKLSNPDNNLAAANPLVVHSTLSVSTTKVKKSMYTSAGGNKIATIVCLILVMLNGVVSCLHSFKREYLYEDTTLSLKYEGLCRFFSLAEVRSATENFNDKLVVGKGGFGEVYKGCIDNGTKIVAMKRLHSNSKQGAREFWTEIEILSKLRHINLVTLIGYCNKGSEMILVYEYMAHGTLADHLYKINNQSNATNYDRKPKLSWDQRLKICMDVARGLEFLHEGNGWEIIHRDIKSTNILLDENFRAKIADFGLSKMVLTTNLMTQISTYIRGTCGYLDPDYFSTSRLTKKSDVYAFGVVLWEVLCGRPAIDTNIEGEDRSLAKWAQYCYNKNEIDQIIEPGLKKQMSPTCLKVFTNLANRCLNSDSNERPSMKDVVIGLRVALMADKFHMMLVRILELMVRKRSRKEISTEEIEEIFSELERDILILKKDNIGRIRRDPLSEEIFKSQIKRLCSLLLEK